jgi:hypothetical protein
MAIGRSFTIEQLGTGDEALAIERSRNDSHCQNIDRQQTDTNRTATGNGGWITPNAKRDETKGWKAGEHSQLLSDPDFARSDRYCHSDQDGPAGKQGGEEDQREDDRSLVEHGGGDCGVGEQRNGAEEEPEHQVCE